MTARNAASSTLFGRVLDWLKQHMADPVDLAGMPELDLDYLASDLGITRADLIDVLPRGADNTLLMEQMMIARGLDPAAMRAFAAAVVRDLELTCTRCDDVRRCRRELAAATAAQHCHEFCPNAAAFDDILAR
ncbi:MAG: DUF6455 family protein [Acetobacteraceae bacterium]|nr:DUF6455 family protein [Acetobacteraceae bacterium]